MPFSRHACNTALSLVAGTSQIFRLRHNASRGVSWFVSKGFNGPVKIFGTFLFSSLSAHYVKPYFHRMLPRREGNVREYLYTSVLGSQAKSSQF